jgi:hypothetical protein
MSTATQEPVIKTGKTAPVKAQKETAPRTTTPKLVCNVTGVARYTNATYLANKASKAGTTIETYLGHYVNRTVAKMLREGKTVAEIQGILGITYDSPLANTPISDIIRYNGKQKRSK